VKPVVGVGTVNGDQLALKAQVLREEEGDGEGKRSSNSVDIDIEGRVMALLAAQGLSDIAVKGIWPIWMPQMTTRAVMVIE
jgi:hypothetical protein